MMENGWGDLPFDEDVLGRWGAMSNHSPGLTSILILDKLS